MRVYYHLSKYISHRLSGLDFIACLELLGHEVLTESARAKEADLAVLHDDPLNYPAALAALPSPRPMPVIAYAVWEADILPEAYSANMALADHVWTCSHFARACMLPRFPQTAVVPHVVRRKKPSAADLTFARETMRPDDGRFVFFSIADSVNPRKNVGGLLSAFAALRAQLPAVRLVLKQYRKAMDFRSLPGVVCVDEELSDGQMAALHALSHAYVSAHHAEAWGLGLSEAMSFGKPVVATGYSGNMEYMDEGNSLPVEYDLTPVSAEMCRLLPLFTPDMRWAAIRPESLVRAMRRAAEGKTPPDLPRRAVETAGRFSLDKVAEIVEKQLCAIMKKT